MTKNSFIAEVTFKVSSQSHMTIRLKNEKCFTNRKNLTQTMKITWSGPLDLSQLCSLWFHHPFHSQPDLPG